MRDEGGLEDRISVGLLARAFPRWTRFAARSATRPPFPPDHPPGHVPAAWLHILAALRNPRRVGRSNPRQAKRSHTYPHKRADRTLRPPPRGLLTLVLLPLTLPEL